MKPTAYKHLPSGMYFDEVVACVNPEDLLPLYAIPEGWALVPAEILPALEEVVRISDRKHDAWDRAHAAIKRAREG